MLSSISVLVSNTEKHSGWQLEELHSYLPKTLMHRLHANGSDETNSIPWKLMGDFAYSCLMSGAIENVFNFTQLISMIILSQLTVRVEVQYI